MLQLRKGVALAAAGFWLALTLGGCGGTGTAAPKGTVKVLYAGSLVGVNENNLGPAFSKATGYAYQGEGMAALAAANLILSKAKQPDVFLSMGYGPLENLVTARLVSWAVPFARDQMVIAYNPASSVGKELAAGKVPWYTVLEGPGVSLGRTNPDTDPQGQSFLFMLRLAQTYYKQPGLANKVLANAQIFDETSILSRLQGGQLGASSSYLGEAVQHHLSYIILPGAINMGDPSQAANYATQSYTMPTGRVVTGKPMVVYATVLNKGADKTGGLAFVKFLLGTQGQAIYRKAGYASAAGLPTKGTVPSGIRP